MKRASLKIEGIQVEIAYDNNSIHVYNAYPVKETLKRQGYRWNPTGKSWYINTDDFQREISRLQFKEEKFEEKSETQGFPSSLSVTQLRNKIDYIIKQELNGTVWVRGIIGSEVKDYQWSSYFDLKDEDSKTGLYFNSEIRKEQRIKISYKLKSQGVADKLEKDLPVFLLCEIAVPLRNSVDIRLKVIDILPEYTQSKLKSQRDITIEKLKKLGIASLQKEKKLKKCIKNIVIISSRQGTSFQDIMAGLHPFENKYSFIFKDARMEGRNAVNSIIKAINETYLLKNLDLIILARGGGSEQSLSTFNDYELCRFICESPIPIITAIGHEKDLSAAELCSHFTPTPSTPSGVGAWLGERYLNLKEEIKELILKLQNIHINKVEREKISLENRLKDIPIKINTILMRERKRLKSAFLSYKQAGNLSIKKEKEYLIKIEKDLFRANKRIILKNQEILNKNYQFLIRKGKAQTNTKSYTIKEQIKNIQRNKIIERNKNKINNLKEIIAKLKRASLTRLNKEEKELLYLKKIIVALDPQAVLNRGYTIIYNQEEKIITNLKEFNKNDNFIVQFKDGKSKIIRNKESI